MSNSAAGGGMGASALGPDMAHNNSYVWSLSNTHQGRTEQCIR